MRQLLHNNKAQGVGGGAMIGSVVALMVSIVVGLLIWYKINAGVVGVGGANGVAARALFNTSNTTSNTIWTLMPIVGIVMIAGIILAIVTNFGRGSAA